MKERVRFMTIMPATPTADPSPADFARCLLRRREVAAMLGIHPKTVSKIKDRLRPLHIAPRVWRWRRADVLAYIEGLAG